MPLTEEPKRDNLDEDDLQEVNLGEDRERATVWEHFLGEARDEWWSTIVGPFLGAALCIWGFSTDRALFTVLGALVAWVGAFQLQSQMLGLSNPFDFWGFADPPFYVWHPGQMVMASLLSLFVVGIGLASVGVLLVTLSQCGASWAVACTTARWPIGGLGCLYALWAILRYLIVWWEWFGVQRGRPH